MTLPLHHQLAFLAFVFVAIALFCRGREWLKARRERKAKKLAELFDGVVPHRK